MRARSWAWIRGGKRRKERPLRSTRDPRAQGAKERPYDLDPRGCRVCLRSSRCVERSSRSRTRSAVAQCSIPPRSQGDRESDVAMAERGRARVLPPAPSARWRLRVLRRMQARAQEPVPSVEAERRRAPRPAGRPIETHGREHQAPASNGTRGPHLNAVAPLPPGRYRQLPGAHARASSTSVATSITTSTITIAQTRARRALFTRRSTRRARQAACGRTRAPPMPDPLVLGRTPRHTTRLSRSTPPGRIHRRSRSALSDREPRAPRASGY
jgi:hypothetical protein